MITSEYLEEIQYLEEIRYELFSIQRQAIYLRNIYGDTNFLKNLTEEEFLTANRIFILQNYRFYAQMQIEIQESLGNATHLYHQSILDSFETIYISHRKFIGQDF